MTGYIHGGDHIPGVIFYVLQSSDRPKIFWNFAKKEKLIMCVNNMLIQVDFILDQFLVHE